MLEKVIAIVAEGLGVEAGNLNAETTNQDMKRLIKNCSHIFRITDRFSNG